MPHVDFFADQTIEWRTSDAPVPYPEALAQQSARNAALLRGEARELIWQLEHPAVYTAGTRAQRSDLLDPRFDVVETGRGGQYTYHGPGQRVTYALLDLRKRGRNIRRYVSALEGWVIAALADFGIEAWPVCERVGIWCKDIDGREAKIGAIGVRVKRWITMHGLAVNLDPDLSHFDGIVPCGIAEFGVTSAKRLGVNIEPSQWDAAMIRHGRAFLAALGA